MSVFLVVLSFILYKVDFFLEDKYSYQKYYDFYEEEENIDVFFLGTSHVINAIHPMELWDDYGIVSYNLSNYSEVMSVNYWQLVNALEYTTPKVVVVDLFSLGWEAKNISKHLHHFTDYMPIGKTKANIVIDLLPKEDRLEYLFEISIYHSRWDQLSKTDFLPEPWCEKGAEMRLGITSLAEPQLIEKNQYNYQDKGNREYLQKIINLCKEKDIHVLMVYIPFADVAEGQLEEANYGDVIAEEQNVSYINFFYKENLINYQIDKSDGNHVNVSGARKLTDYIGKYIASNFNVDDQRENRRYEHWQEDWERYKEYKYGMLKEQTNFQNYMLMFYDDDLQVDVYLSKDSLVYQDSIATELLKNVESIGNMSYHIQEDVSQTGDIILGVTDIETGELIDFRQFRRTASDVYELYEP